MYVYIVKRFCKISIRIILKVHDNDFSMQLKKILGKKDIFNFDWLCRNRWIHDAVTLCINS